MKHFWLIFITTFVFSGSLFSQTRLVDQRISLKNGKSFTLKIAEGFEIIPAMEGLKRVRFFAKSPDGRIFVTDMYNLADDKRGTVYILDGWDAKTGKFAKAHPVHDRSAKSEQRASSIATRTARIGSILPKPTSSRGENSPSARPSRPTPNRKCSRPFPITASATNTAAGI